MNDSFFRWFPIIIACTQLVFLPIVAVVLKNQVEKVMEHSAVLDGRIAEKIKEHNANLYAHPALADLKKLENNIETLSTEVRSLGLKIERITPRRRQGDEPEGT